MLNLNLRVGDDVYVGKSDQELEEYQPVILKAIEGDCLIVLTPDEELALPLSGESMNSGVHGMVISALPDPMDKSQVTIGLDAPPAIRILRGRLYRRALN